MICTYQDYAEEEEVATTDDAMVMDQTLMLGGGDASEQIVFPVKLHTMLSQVDKEGLAHSTFSRPYPKARSKLMSSHPLIISGDPPLVVGWASHGTLASGCLGFLRRL
jgi:hypothetical protein